MFYPRIKIMQVNKQPWLHSLKVDSLFILSPPFIALLIVILFPAQFQSSSQINPLFWLVLIVFIDVAHVYSTLYRTYFTPHEFRQGLLLVIVPLLCYIIGVLVHSIDGILFWRILTYLAVFHFIRQQYGFMRLYSRKEKATHFYKILDKITIYSATIYPITYWHLEGKRNFNWLIENDFISISAPTWLHTTALVIYLLIIVTYTIKEVFIIIKTRHFNLPRNLFIAGTLLSWYFGIVYFNGDLAFTTLNVISHGIPYMALIWIMEKKKQAQTNTEGGFFLRALLGTYGPLLFVGSLIIMAYFEEGLWDGLVWREHRSIFQIFENLPKIENPQHLSLVIPLLALPQATHYVLDGFIWRSKKIEPASIEEK
jgi:hypothetical protein